MRLTNKKEADAQRKAYERRLEQGYPRNIPEERFLKLAAYEDAEEQGRLVILPCKVGDRVYRIHTHDHIEEQYIMAIHVSASGVWYWDETGRETPVEKIGKTVFLSREEAEAALKGEREDV